MEAGIPIEELVSNKSVATKRSDAAIARNDGGWDTTSVAGIAS
jgi:hypothetical protein